jgi:hypothetical protein
MVVRQRRRDVASLDSAPRARPCTEPALSDGAFRVRLVLRRFECFGGITYPLDALASVGLDIVNCGILGVA